MFRYIVTVVYLERAEGAVVEGLSHVDDLLTLNTHKTIKTVQQAESLWGIKKIHSRAISKHSPSENQLVSKLNADSVDTCGSRDTANFLNINICADKNLEACMKSPLQYQNL